MVTHLIHPLGRIWRRWLGGGGPVTRPDFTIIIPIRLPGPKFAKSLESIQSQRGVSVEIIVAEYGACQDARLAMNAFIGGSRLRHIAMRRAGVYEGMNAAIRKASGSVFYFLGAGDRLRPGVLEEIYRNHNWSGSCLVYGNVFMEDLQVTYDGHFDARKLRQKNICHQAVFYSRRLFAKHGYYDTRYRLLADYAYNLRAFGDAGTSKCYYPLTIADYEGAGLSARCRDEIFMKDRARLNQSYLPMTK